MVRDVTSDGQLIEGCDVSHFQGNIDWSAVAAAPKYFAYIKATDGISHTDELYATNYAGAGAAGILRGAYHYFRHGMPGADQASYFLSVASPTAGDLPPALDVEDPPADQPSGAYVTEVAAWISAITTALGGQAPLIYCSPGFWTSTLNSPNQFSANPLWLAQYTTHDPTIPNPWTRFTFWQYTDSGTVSGMANNVDLDRFQGSMDDLNHMVLTGATLTSSIRRSTRSPGTGMRARRATPTSRPVRRTSK